MIKKINKKLEIIFHKLHEKLKDGELKNLITPKFNIVEYERDQIELYRYKISFLDDSHVITLEYHVEQKEDDFEKFEEEKYFVLSCDKIIENTQLYYFDIQNIFNKQLECFDCDIASYIGRLASGKDYVYLSTVYLHDIDSFTNEDIENIVTIVNTLWDAMKIYDTMIDKHINNNPDNPYTYINNYLRKVHSIVASSDKAELIQFPDEHSNAVFAEEIFDGLDYIIKLKYGMGHIKISWDNEDNILQIEMMGIRKNLSRFTCLHILKDVLLEHGFMGYPSSHEKNGYYTFIKDNIYFSRLDFTQKDPHELAQLILKLYGLQLKIQKKIDMVTK